MLKGTALSVCLMACAAASGGKLSVRSTSLLRRTRVFAAADDGDAKLPAAVALPPGRPADIARIGVLLTVPIAWGTYAPAVKIAYAVASNPAIPGILLSAGQYVVATLTLSLVASLARPKAGAPLRSDAEGDDRPKGKRSKWLAAFELASYLFFANWLQIQGLTRVPADRAAFLVQTSTLVVPLLDAARRGGLGRLPARTWAASFLAFAGVVTMTGGAASLASFFSASSPPAALALPANGDAFILGAALIYSWHVIRLSALAPDVEPLQLAPRKAASELLLASASLALLLAIPSLPAGGDLRAFGAELAALSAHDLALLGGAAAWMGAVTTGYTMWAQSYGQSGSVSAPVASLIYSSQPLWSAAFAYLLLGESMGRNEAAGGALIVCALLLGALAPAGRPSDEAVLAGIRGVEEGEQTSGGRSGGTDRRP